MILIKGATVHDGKGNAAVKDVLVCDEGWIDNVAENIPVQGGMEVIDAAGKHLLPGFIDPMSNWGILGPGREIRGNAEDNDEHTDVLTPEMNIIYAFNGRGVTIQQLGAYGITTVGTAPGPNNIFAGLMGVFDVDGINPFKMCIKEKAAMKANVTDSITKFWGAKNIAPMTHMGIFSIVTEQLRKAKEYTGEKRDPKLAALKDVVENKIPLFTVAKTDMEVNSMLHVAKEYGLEKLVLCSGSGLQDCEEQLLDVKPGIILAARTEDFSTEPKKGDELFIYNLYKKGLTVGLATGVDGTMCTREDLLWAGLEMYKASKDAEAVVSMLSYNNAKLLGVDDVTGSIEKGKRADLVLYSDHPVKRFDAELELTLMKGKAIYKKGDEKKCFI